MRTLDKVVRRELTVVEGDPFNKNRWDYIGFEFIGENKRAVVHHTIIFEGNKLVKFVSKNDIEDNENLEEKSKEQSTRKLEQ